MGLIKYKKLIRIKKNLWYKYLASKRNPQIFNEFKEKKKQVEALIKSDLRKFEYELVRKGKKKPKLFYSYVNSKLTVKKQINKIQDSGGKNVSDPIRVCEILNSQFESVFIKNEDSNLPHFESRTKETLKLDPYETFSLLNVTNELKLLDSFKSMGSDFISQAVLKQTAESIAIPLSLIFIKSYLTGKVPVKWTEANVTPLLKKGSKLNASNYRPVSLTSIPCKVMEKLIKKPVMHFLLKNKLISIRQHGFLEKKSCITNLLEIMDLATEALNKRFPFDIVFLDFAKAFVTVPHKRLLLKLVKYGFDKKIVDWIRAFLGNRKQRVVMGDNVSSWKNVTSGVPQGSVLGPLLFIIYINDLSEKIKYFNELFADDTKIGTILDDMSKVEILKDDLNIIYKWTYDWLI